MIVFVGWRDAGLPARILDKSWTAAKLKAAALGNFLKLFVFSGVKSEDG
jgi:hypothetical protein